MGHDPLENLARDGELMAYRHEGFWQCMDTLRETHPGASLAIRKRSLEEGEVGDIRTLVTGHRGYIGSLLVPMLMEAGHDVVGFDSDLFEACTFHGRLLDVPSLRKDIRDVEAADVEVDAIIHLAALSNDPMGDYRPALTEQINFQASLRLASHAKEAGVRRFLFASSCSNYGQAGSNLLDETAELNPVTPYGLSKVEWRSGFPSSPIGCLAPRICGLPQRMGWPHDFGSIWSSTT